MKPVRTLPLALLLIACATTGDGAVADMTQAGPPDMVCTENAPPAQCVVGEAKSERELLNRCVSEGDGVTVILRDSYVPAALWDGRCALPSL